MSKPIFCVYLILLSVILLSACDLSETTSPIAITSRLSTERPPSSLNPMPSSSYTIIPIATPIPAPIPFLPTVTAWSTFTNPKGVSLEYPANWQIKTITTYDHPLFTLDTMSGVSTYYYIYLNVFDRPIEEQRITDPHVWESPDYSYEILW